MSDILIAISSSVIFSSAVTSLIIWLTKTWISEHLKESIKYEYAQKMEEYKAAIDLESQKQILNFKSELERNLVIQTVGNKSLEEINKVSVQKIVQSVEALWEAVLALRTIMPPIAGLIDSLAPDKVNLYQSVKASRDFPAIKGKADSELFINAMKNKLSQVENFRIYLGEYIWSLYNALSSINIQFYFTIHFQEDDNKLISWHEDETIKTLVKSVLTAEELKIYESYNSGKLGMIRNFLENKILVNLKALISAEKITDDSLRQARIIDTNVQKLKEKYELQSQRILK